MHPKCCNSRIRASKVLRTGVGIVGSSGCSGNSAGQVSKVLGSTIPDIPLSSQSSGSWESTPISCSKVSEPSESLFSFSSWRRDVEASSGRTWRGWMEKTRNYILQFIDTHAGHVYSLSKVKHVNAQSLHERHMNILYTVCPGFQLGWNLLERLQEEHALCTMARM